MSHKQYKCHQCRWVHAAIPLSAAQAQVQAVNGWHASKREPETEDMASYMCCFKCGAPSANFVPAMPGDVPFGATIQGAVVPGVFDDQPDVQWGDFENLSMGGLSQPVSRVSQGRQRVA